MQLTCTLIITTAFFAVESASASDLAAAPSAVYVAYLEEFRRLESLDDPRCDKYLSAEARRRKAAQAAKANTPASVQWATGVDPKKATLQMAKSMRPYPIQPLAPVERARNGIQQLTYSWIEKENGTAWTRTIIVELVNENGWKLKSERWESISEDKKTQLSAQSKWSY